MLKVNLSKKSETFLKRLPIKQAKQIVWKIQTLRKSPSLVNSKKLKGHNEFMRVKSWEFRIVYYIRDKILFIVIIWKRNDNEVYKRLLR